MFDLKASLNTPFPPELLSSRIYHEANSHLFFPRLQAKAKYNAWKKVAVEDGLTAEEAQDKYVKKIEEMKEKYGYDANKEPEAVGGN